MNYDDWEMLQLGLRKCRWEKREIFLPLRLSGNQNGWLMGTTGRGLTRPSSKSSVVFSESSGGFPLMSESFDNSNGVSPAIVYHIVMPVLSGISHFIAQTVSQMLARLSSKIWNTRTEERRVHLQLDESQMPKCKGCAHHYHMLVFHSHFIVQFFLLKRQAKSHCSELAGCGKHWVHEGLTHFVSPRAKSVLASLVLLVIWGFCRHHTTLSSLKNLAVLRDGGFSVHLYICF